MKNFFHAILIGIIGLTITIIPVFSQTGILANPENIKQSQEVYLVKDINLGTASSNPGDYMVLDSVSYFTAETDSSHYALWKTDGTPTGTSLVKDDFMGPFSLDDQSKQFTEFNGSLFFKGGTADNYPELWKTDGSESGTIQITNFTGNADPYNLNVVNNTLYFNGGPLLGFYQTDGTPEGVSLVSNDYLPLATKFGETLYYADCDAPNHCSLGRFGTVSGLVIPEINVSFNPMMEFNGYLYFSADDGENGIELWRTDGETEINMFMDLSPSGDSSPYILGIGNELLFFQVTQENGNEALWRTDGTQAGTFAISSENINFKESLGSIDQRPNLTSGGLFMKCTIPGNSFDSICFSDGTTLGTYPVTEMNIINNDPHITLRKQIQVYQNAIYFPKYDAEHGIELWRSDGTVDGTALWLDIIPGKISSNPLGFGLCGERLCFSAIDLTHGRELWSSDGSLENTALILDINQQPADANPQNFSEVYGQLFFTAIDASSDTHLWKINGSANNIQTVVDQIGVKTQTLNQSFIAVNNHIIYQGIDPEHTYQSQIWALNLEDHSNWLIQDLDSHKNNSGFQITGSENLVYFYDFDEVNGDLRIWQTDGTPNGTSINFRVSINDQNQWNIQNMTVLNDQLILVKENSLEGNFDLILFNQAMSEIKQTISSTNQIALIDTDEDYLYYYRDQGIYSLDNNGNEVLIYALPGYTYEKNLNQLFKSGNVFYLVKTGNELVINSTDQNSSGWVEVFDSDADTGLLLDQFEWNQSFVLNIYTEKTMDEILTPSWKLILTDGSPENTQDQIGTGMDVFGVQGLGNHLYFLGRDPQTQDVSLYQSDGTIPGTTLITNFGASVCTNYGQTTFGETFLYNGVYYFPMNMEGENVGCELWAYDLLTQKIYLPLIEVN